MVAPTPQPASTPDELLKDWLKKTHSRSQIHYSAAHHFGTINICIGIPSVIIASIVSSTIFANVDTSPTTSAAIANSGSQLSHFSDIFSSVGGRVFTGILSLLATGLAGIQNFLKYGELSERHRNVAAGYGSIHRQIAEEFVWLNEAKDPSHRNDIHKVVDSIRAKLDSLEHDAPDISDTLYGLLNKKSNNFQTPPKTDTGSSIQATPITPSDIIQ